MRSRHAGRRGLIVAAVCVWVCSAALAGAQSVDVDLPAGVATTEDFLLFRDAAAQSPEGGAAVFVLAMLLFEQDATLGRNAMVIALDANELRQDPAGYQGYAPGNRADDFVSRYLVPRPYLARSYLLGTSPENGYNPPESRAVRLSRNSTSTIAGDQVKVFVSCTGADTPRPITMRRNNRGVWKAYEYSSLFVGVRPPAAVADDPL